MILMIRNVFNKSLEFIILLYIKSLKIKNMIKHNKIFILKSTNEKI